MVKIRISKEFRLKFYLILLLSIICKTNYLLAQPVFYTNERNVSINTGITAKSIYGFEPDSINGFAILEYQKPEYYADLGYKISDIKSDLVFSSVYWPQWNENVNIGVGMQYHLLSYQNLFHEHDIMAGVYIKLKGKKIFTVSANIDYYLKLAKLYLLEKNPWLMNNTIGINTKFNWNINNFDIYFAMGTYSYFRYILFCAPDLVVGGNWKFSKHLSVGCEFEAQYLDFFTISANLDSVEFKTFLKVTF